MNGISHKTKLTLSSFIAVLITTAVVVLLEVQRHGASITLS